MGEAPDNFVLSADQFARRELRGERERTPAARAPPFRRSGAAVLAASDGCSIRRAEAKRFGNDGVGQDSIGGILRPDSGNVDQTGTETVPRGDLWSRWYRSPRCGFGDAS